MTPTPQPTIYDIISPKFVVLPDLSAVVVSLLACAMGLYLISKLWQRMTKSKPLNGLIRELQAKCSPEHAVQLVVRAVFVATGENISTMSGKELTEFSARYPKLQKTAEFMAARFSPKVSYECTEVLLELRSLLEAQRSK